MSGVSHQIAGESASENSEEISQEKVELENLPEQQIEMGMILRDTHGELHNVISEQEGPPRKYEVRGAGNPMLGTDELHFGLDWLTGEEIQ